MRNEYPSKAYSEFVHQFNIDLELTPKQSSALVEGKGIRLSEMQLDIIVNQMTSEDGIEEFLKENCGILLPLSVSLFVINDKLWSIMQRKVWDPQKMLAMSTIPLCTWDQKHESTSNPKGVKRWPIRPNTLNLSFDEKYMMKIQGEGGDFSGFIEQSQLTMRKWGIPETRKLIPNYIFQTLRIDVALNKAAIEIHPSPRDELDYDYSQHARVFFEHGLMVQVPGEDVTLQVGKRGPTQMAGEVFLHIGKRFEKDEVSKQELLVDIWLRLLGKRLSSVT